VAFFLLSLVALWVAYNALFMLPGKYDYFNFVVAGFGVGLGVLFASMSSRRFAGQASEKRVPIAHILKAPPMAICIFILILFCLSGLVKIAAYR
jgi:hypothetical protein